MPPAPPGGVTGYFGEWGGRAELLVERSEVSRYPAREHLCGLAMCKLQCVRR